MKFRKKPIVIDAMEFTGTNQFDLMRWCDSFDGYAQWRFAGNEVYIMTLEGEMRVTVGDWIIRGVKKEFYPCRPDIFAMTYEPV